MDNALSMQEELQQSVVLSEEDADYDEEEEVPQPIAPERSAKNGLNAPESRHTRTDDTNNAVKSKGVEPGEDKLGKQPVSTKPGSDEDEDAEGDYEPQDQMGDNVRADSEEEDAPFEDDPMDEDADELEDAPGDVDADFEADAEMESEVEPVEGANEALDDEDADEDADEEAETEGVGAVKIKPGETDEDSASEDDASEASDGGDSAGAAEWEAEEEEEEAVENEDEDDDELEIAETTICLFCKKGKDNGPEESSGTVLNCINCSESAHEQCARDAEALDNKNGTTTRWTCPDCLGDDAEPESEEEPAQGDVEEVNESTERGLSPASLRATAPKLARDLLPPQRGAIKPDSHSVFNQLVLDEDPMDGSRVLRKRKTSSAEADENVMLLRKRRKNTSEGSSHGEATQDKVNGGDDSSRPHSARALRLKTTNAEPNCTVVKKTRTSLVMKLRIPTTSLRNILSQKPKSHKKRSHRASSIRITQPAVRNAPAEPPPLAPFFASSYSQPYYSLYDKETDELKGKPYGGILTEAEADTSKTLPGKEDRRRFDEAKQKAEDEWRSRLLAMQAEAEAPVRKSKKSQGPASQIECIEFGGWEIDTWYAAPYPEEYSRNRVLYICEFCLKYMNSDYVAWRHKLKCPAKHPPGDEIYRQGSISFFEVDGRKNPVYCQNLCLLAKLFLGSKTLYYDVEPFLFYVLCEYDDMGYHFVGYFSKEKRASSQNNVSCILTLPIHQRKGYGNLLIDFSYLLTRAEEKTGSPEKPLSDMGLVSYRNYWRLVMCKYLLENTPEDKSVKKGLSIRQISDDTGMAPDDVISALEGLRCLVRDPQTQLYAFRVDLPFCREYVGKWESKNYVKLDPKALTWTPYVMGRSSATNFELGPAISAIAPREDDEDTKGVEVLAESGIQAGDFATLNGNDKKLANEADTTVLESTEPNDNVVEPTEATKPDAFGKQNSEDQENVQMPDALDQVVAVDAETVAAEDDDESWMKPYTDVPIVRFEVYPPVNARRPTGLSRMSSGVARPSLPRAPATVPRPRPRRSLGTRKSSSRPKSGSSKRKTGGTGRGPGRWPKGTKKSDYGNADSGPGLPPAWLQARVRDQVVLPDGSEHKLNPDDMDTQDTVRVQVEHDDMQLGSEPTGAAALASHDGEAEAEESGAEKSEDSEEEEEEEGEDEDEEEVEEDEEEEDEEDDENEDEAEDEDEDAEGEEDADSDPDVVLGDENEEDDEDEDEDAEGEDDD